MIVRTIEPVGWPCTLAEAPPGPFVTTAKPDLLCFKSEYSDASGPISYNDAGERFGPGPKTAVQPVRMVTI